MRMIRKAHGSGEYTYEFKVVAEFTVKTDFPHEDMANDIMFDLSLSVEDHVAFALNDYMETYKIPVPGEIIVESDYDLDKFDSDLS